MWLQESRSVKPSPFKRDLAVNPTLKFGTLRQLRSALGYYDMINLLAADPTGVYMNQRRQILRSPGRPTDSLVFTCHSGGMKARLGTHQDPSWPLEDRHVRWLDKDLNRRYLAATTDEERLELARAGLANITFWLLWLRSCELFDRNG